MRRGMKAIWILPIVAIGLISGCAKQKVGEVNGKTITQAEYYKAMERMTVPITQGENPVRDPATGRLVREQAGYLALRMLIDRQIVLDMAEKEKVMPTEQEIEDELQRQKKNPAFTENMKALGYTEEDIKQEIKVQLAEFKLLTKGITVSDDEVKKAYDANIQRFTMPARVQVALILVDSPRKLEQVRAEIKKGVDFALLATQYRPADMPATTNVTSVWLDENNQMFQQFPLLWQTLQKTAPNNVTDPLPIKLPTAQGKVTDGWVIFKVLDKKERQVVPLDEVKEDLRREMMLRKSKRNLALELMQMRAQAKVTIDIPRYDQRWQEQMKQLQQVLQSHSPATGAPSAPLQGGATP